MEFTPEGFWKLQSGTIIKNFNDLTYLSQEDMMELYETPTRLYDILAIRRNQHDLREEMQKFENSITLTFESVERKLERFHKRFNEIDTRISDMIEEFHSCPLDYNTIDKRIDKKLKQFDDKEDPNFDALNDRIDDRIVQYLKQSILTTANVLKAIATILAVFSALGAIVYGISKLITGK